LEDGDHWAYGRLTHDQEIAPLTRADRARAARLAGWPTATKLSGSSPSRAPHTVAAPRSVSWA